MEQWAFEASFVYQGTLKFSLFLFQTTEPHSLVGSVADLRTGGCWFGPQVGQYSFQGLMIVIAT